MPLKPSHVHPQTSEGSLLVIRNGATGIQSYTFFLGGYSSSFPWVRPEQVPLGQGSRG